MKTLKKLLSVFLVLVALSCVSMSYAASSGTCGEDLTWTLSEDFVLTISGKGEMDNYSWGDQPWVDQCWQIVKVVIGDGVTSVGDNAFAGFESLTEVELPETLTSIGEYAFGGSTLLTAIELPDSLMTIGVEAFASTGLTEVVIGDHVTSIGWGAFGSCDALKSVKLSASLTDLAGGVFLGCRALESIEIPAGVTVIGESMFEGCSSLERVTIPASVTKIGDFAFNNCEKLTTVNYSGTKAQWDAITIDTNNDPLLNAEIVCTGTDEPSEPNVIANGTCGENLTWVLTGDGTLTINGEGAMKGYSSATFQPWRDQKDAIISVVVKGTVSHIGGYSFYGLSNLRSVVVEDGVESIGGHSMKYCQNLSSVTIPASVTEMSVNVFYGSDLLTTAGPIGGGYSVEFGWTKAIPEYAFHSMGQLADVELPDTLISIGQCAFLYCSALTSIDLPDGLVSIGDNAFEQSGLTSVILPDSVTTLGSEAFQYVPMTELVLSKNLTVIPYKAFSECAELTAVEIPASVTTIENRAFERCTSLVSIAIPAGVTSIGQSAFSGCSSLTTVNYAGTEEQWNAIEIGDGNDYLLNAEIIFSDSGETPETPEAAVASGTCGENLTWVLTGDGTLTINGEGAMEDYRSYTSQPWYENSSMITCVVIEEGVTHIGDSAFEYCSCITSSAIAVSVTSIGDSAFYGCSSLTTVNYTGSRLQWALIEIAIYNNSLKEAEIICTGTGGSASGTCGESLTWELTSDGTLTISGEGAMTDYDYYNLPWGSLRDVITDVVIEEGVTSIGTYAFRDCSNLTSVAISEGVTSIENYAFRYCTSLTDITIPVSMKKIGFEAFYECSALVRVDYNGGKIQWLSEIKVSNGNDCLTNATINYHGTEGITGTCGENLVWELDNDGALTISGEGEMENISWSDAPWEDYLDWILSIVVQEGVTSVGKYAFNDCSNVTRIELADSVASIGDYAFRNCSALTTMRIPSGVYKLENSTFSGCTSLQEIEIPYSVECFGSSIYVNMNLFTSCPDVVIKGYSLSHAQYYAEKHGLTWESIGETPVTTVYITPADENRSDEDVEAELRAALRSHTRVILADGIYKIRYSLYLGNLCNFSLEAEHAGCAEILSSDREDVVIDIYGNMITLDGLILGHTKGGLPLVDGCGMDGYVVYAHSTKDLFIRNCDLWGCGVVATVLSNCDRVTVADSILRDCMYNAITLWNSQNVCYKNCVISGNRYKENETTDYPCVVNPDSTTVSFQNCWFINNRNTALISEVEATDGIFVDCVYQDNAWQGLSIQYYGVCAGDGLTWQAVPNEYNGYDVYLGRDIVFADGTVLKSGVGTIPDYSDDSCPWKRLTVNEIIADDIAAPTAAVKLNSDDKPVISWTAVDGVDEYRVLYATSENGPYSLLTTTTETSVTHSDAVSGKTYYYKVCSVIGEVRGAFSEIVSVTVSQTAELDAPTVKAENIASTGKIKVSWNKIAGAEKYEVYRATSKNGKYTKLITTSKTSISNTSITAGKTYYYKVRAIAGDVKGEFSAAVGRTCDLAQPKVTVSNIASSGKIKVSWNKVDGAVKYEVWRATSKNGTYTRLTTTTSTSINNTKINAGEAYYYKVKAIAKSSAANSAYSEVVGRTCDLARPVVTVKLNSNGKPVISWKKVDGAVKYEVWRATSKNGTYTRITTTTKTSITNTKTEAGVTYYYKVKAIAKSSAANSAFSTVAYITAK